MTSLSLPADDVDLVTAFTPDNNVSATASISTKDMYDFMRSHSRIQTVYSMPRVLWYAQAGKLYTLEKDRLVSLREVINNISSFR